MANFSGKRFKVWKSEQHDKFTKVDLGDSRKNKDGTYDNFTWFGVMLVGDAHKLGVEKDDVIEVTSAQIYQEKYNDKWGTKVTVFGANIVGEKKKDDDFSFGSLDESDDDNPFI